MTDHTTKLRDQNDLFRVSKISGKHTDLKGQSVMTEGIAALEPEVQQDIALKIMCFEEFTEDNDPHGEHDFGAFTHNGKKIFWKIDYYALDMQHGSEDPADLAQTFRVLTIMLASEY